MSRENEDDLRKRVGREAQAYQAAVDAVDAAAADKLGINRTDLRCLEILSRGEPASPSRIGTELDLTTGSVTAMLDRLEKLNYLTRSPDPTDRRKILVRITPAANRKVWQIYGPIAEDGAALLSAFTTPELTSIVDYLQRSRALQDHHRTRITKLPTTPTKPSSKKR